MGGKGEIMVAVFDQTFFEKVWVEGKWAERVRG
jgi:hypothetical protein